MPATTQDRIMVQLPPTISAAVKAAAKADGRSVSNYIAQILTAHARELPTMTEDDQAAYEAARQAVLTAPLMPPAIPPTGAKPPAARGRTGAPPAGGAAPSSPKTRGKASRQ